MIVETTTIDGREIEIHQDRFGQRRYWVKVDGLALFQHGRMRLRTFATPETARAAATKELP